MNGIKTNSKYIVYSNKPPNYLYHDYIKDKCNKCGTMIYINKKDKDVKKLCYKCGGYV